MAKLLDTSSERKLRVDAFGENVTIKSHQTTSIKRPITVVSPPIIWKISRYRATKSTGYDLIITKAYGREYSGFVPFLILLLLLGPGFQPYICLFR